MKKLYCKMMNETEQIKKIHIKVKKKVRVQRFMTKMMRVRFLPSFKSHVLTMTVCHLSQN